MSRLSIGELAARAGKRPSAIRYYEAIGLLPAPERVSGRRVYDDAALQRLTAIDAAQHGGLTLDEIKRLLASAARLSDLAARKLPEVAAEIARAESVRRWLELAAACTCPTVEECGLFSAPGCDRG